MNTHQINTKQLKRSRTFMRRIAARRRNASQTAALSRRARLSEATPARSAPASILGALLIAAGLAVQGPSARAQSVQIPYADTFDTNVTLSSKTLDKYLGWGPQNPLHFSGDPHWWFHPWALGEFGYELAYDLKGRAYIHALASAGGGTAHVHDRVDIQVEWPKTGHVGEQVTVNTALGSSLDKPVLSIKSKPVFQASLTAGLGADVSVNFWLEAFGYYLRDGTNNPLLEWHPKDWTYTFFDLQKFVKDHQQADLQKGILWANFSDPDFNGDVSAGDSLTLHDIRPVASLTADITNLITQNTLGVNFSDKYDIDGYTLGYDFLDLRAILDLQAQLDVAAKPRYKVRFDFDDGQPSQTIEVGKSLTFTFAKGPLHITPTLIEEGEMTDKMSLVLGSELTFDPFHIYGRGGINTGIHKFDLSFDLPPNDAWKMTLEGPSVPLEITSGTHAFNHNGVKQMPYTLIADTSPMKISVDPEFGSVGKQFNTISGKVTGGYSTKPGAAATKAVLTYATHSKDYAGSKSEASDVISTQQKTLDISIAPGGDAATFAVDEQEMRDVVEQAKMHMGDVVQVQLITPSQQGQAQNVSNTQPVKYHFMAGGPNDGQGGNGGWQVINWHSVGPGDPVENNALTVGMGGVINATQQIVSAFPGSLMARDAACLYDGMPVPTQITFTSEKMPGGRAAGYKTTYTLAAQIPPALVTRSGAHTLEFKNGAQAKSAALFGSAQVADAKPLIRHVAMRFAPDVKGNHSAIVFGQGFTPDSKIMIGGKAVRTRFVSASRLELDADDPTYTASLGRGESQLQVANALGDKARLSTPYMQRVVAPAAGKLEITTVVFPDYLARHRQEPQTARPPLQPVRDASGRLTGTLGNNSHINPLPPTLAPKPTLAALLTMQNTGGQTLQRVMVRSVMIRVGGVVYPLPFPKEDQAVALRPAGKQTFLLRAPLAPDKVQQLLDAGAKAANMPNASEVEIVVDGEADGRPFHTAQRTQIARDQTPPPAPSRIRVTVMQTTRRV